MVAVFRGEWQEAKARKKINQLALYIDDQQPPSKLRVWGQVCTGPCLLLLQGRRV